MRADVIADEWYPVFMIETDNKTGLMTQKTIEISDEEYARYLRVMEEFRAIQRWLEGLI